MYRHSILLIAVYLGSGLSFFVYHAYLLASFSSPELSDIYFSSLVLPSFLAACVNSVVFNGSLGRIASGISHHRSVLLTRLASLIFSTATIFSSVYLVIVILYFNDATKIFVAIAATAVGHATAVNLFLAQIGRIDGRGIHIELGPLVANVTFILVVTFIDLNAVSYSVLIVARSWLVLIYYRLVLSLDLFNFINPVRLIYRKKYKRLISLFFTSKMFLEVDKYAATFCGPGAISIYSTFQSYSTIISAAIERLIILPNLRFFLLADYRGRLWRRRLLHSLFFFLALLGFFFYFVKFDFGSFNLLTLLDDYSESYVIWSIYAFAMISFIRPVSNTLSQYLIKLGSTQLLLYGGLAVGTSFLVMKMALVYSLNFSGLLLGSVLYFMANLLFQLYYSRLRDDKYTA
jgi:hypothetical protein